MNAQEEIQAILDMLVDAWNNNDISIFASLFTEDASYVSSVGVWLRRRQAIRDELADNMAGTSRHGRVILTHTSINLVRTDIAIAHNTWELIPITKSVESRKGIMTHVMVNDGQHWRIAALQNTDVQT